MAVRRGKSGGLFSRPSLALFAGSRPPDPDKNDPDAVARWHEAMKQWQQDIADTTAAHNQAQLWTFEGHVGGMEEAAKALLESGGLGSNVAIRVPAMLRYARHAIAVGDAEQAARWGYELAELTREHDLAVEHEREAGTGHKQRVTGKNGADQRHGDEASRARVAQARCATVERYMAAGMSRNAAVAMTAEEHGISERQVFRNLAAKQKIR